MSRLPLEIKDKALNYRKRGYSLREIVKILGIAQSTASLWAREVRLSNKAKKRLLSKIRKGQYIAAENKKARTVAFNLELLNKAKEQISKSELNKNIGQLICAMIYWCEGNKDSSSGIGFTNSDPNLTRNFLDLLEGFFSINRKKIVARLHLHEYHNSEKQMKFWAKKISISQKQFRKPYTKPNTGKRIRNNYPGCISVRYYDSILARKLLYLAQAFMVKGA